MRTKLASLSVLFAAVASAATVSPPFFMPPLDDNLTAPTIIQDSSGAYHAAYLSISGIGSPTFGAVYYASCAANCTTQTNWVVTMVGNRGSAGGAVRLQVDSAGRPRLLWHFLISAFDVGFRYASCDGGCSSLTNWTIVSLPRGAILEQGQFFALDHLDRPRFIYNDTSFDHQGLFYVFCDSNCTSLANWFEGQIASSVVTADFDFYLSVLYDQQGRARMIYRDTRSGQSSLAYAECATDCHNSANWSASSLFQFGADDDFSFDLDNLGRPRVAVFQSDRLFYAWCNTGCTTLQNWGSVDLGLSNGHGRDVDMLLDSSERPHMVYQIRDPNALGYSTCNSGCESPQGLWSSQDVETAAALNASEPVPLKTDCTLSFWGVGFHPSLTMDGSGNLGVLYDADHSQVNPNPFSGCQLHKDMQRVRFARLTVGGALRRGDVNADGTINAADIMALINLLFGSGGSSAASDANADGATTVSDIFYLINHIFSNGPAPPA